MANQFTAAKERKLHHMQETRDKIQAGQIINRLHKCVMGEIELSSQQVAAASKLLNKVLPDLQAAQITGDVHHHNYALMPDEAMTADEWQMKHAPKVK